MLVDAEPLCRTEDGLGMTFFTADRSTCPHHLLALTGENVMLTTSLLWFNAAGFVALANRPWWALGQAAVYILILVFLNRKSLFSNLVAIE